MRRDEAYVKLSMIASNELLSSHVSCTLFVIRDSICCYMPEQGSSEQKADYLYRLAGKELLSLTIREMLKSIADCIATDKFEPECTHMCHSRCGYCKHYSMNNSSKANHLEKALEE